MSLRDHVKTIDMYRGLCFICCLNLAFVSIQSCPAGKGSSNEHSSCKDDLIFTAHPSEILLGSPQTPNLTLTCSLPNNGTTKALRLSVGKKCFNGTDSEILLISENTPDTVSIVDESYGPRLKAAGSIDEAPKELRMELSPLLYDDATDYYCKTLYLTNEGSVKVAEVTVTVSEMLTGAVKNSTDPCINYSFLDGNPRQRQKPTDAKDTPICDKDLKPGWYRFTGESGVVAMSKVGKLHCGTVSPIWMNDTLPPPGSLVQKTFCFNHEDIKPNGCMWHAQASVKNCEKFVVYKLPIQSTLCPMGLCIEVPCQPGKWSPTGFEPCGDPYPKLGNVSLTGPDELTPGMYQHVCHFLSDDKKPSARFNVTWSMDDVPISYEILSGHQREAFFNMSDWLGYLGESLTCSVKSYYTKGENRQSQEYTSNSYFGGIKIEPDPLHLVEGQDKRIEVVSTLPLNCKDPVQHKFCELRLNIRSPDLFAVDSCLMSMTSRWNSSTHEARIPVQIASVVDPVVKADGPVPLTVDLSYKDNATGLEMWTNASEFQVIVHDTKPKKCVASGDPHIMESFSYIGKYNLYHHGDFNFATDIRVPIAVQIEANAFYQPTHLPLVSAVAVQTGNDVTIVDTEGGSKIASVTSNGLVTSHTVQACGTNEYQISTPTGHRLNIYLMGNAKKGFYLNVRTNFPAGVISLANITNIYNDTYHEICDLIATTDGQKTFGTQHEISANVIDMFRVEPSQNLFKGDTVNLPKTTPKKYCSCTRDEDHILQATCESKVDDPLIKRPSCKIIHPKVVTTTPSKTRPGENTFGKEPAMYRQWPTPSGITEKHARDKCHADIIRYAPKHCIRNNDPNLTDAINACVEDVLASDGFDYNSGAVQSFKARCEEAILDNVANYNKTGGHFEAPEIVTHQCPALCTMHGACVDGVCHCQNGWEWKDCSVKSGEQFQIKGVQGGILCDKSTTDDCFKPVLNVENLGNISHCSVDSTAYYRGRPTNAERQFMGTQERQSSHSVSCNFASHISQTNFHAKSFRIHLVPESMTQDGKFIDYVVYDGVCQKCLEDLTCFMREDACLIDGKCQKAGEKRILDNRFECDPNVNMNQWTIKRDNVDSIPVSIGRK